MPHSIQKVFLTGANGFTASHILSDLVKAGYQVTASVRSKARSQEVLDIHPEYKDHVKFVYVPDFTAPGAFDEAIKQQEGSLDYVIHTASPVNFSVKDIQKDLLDPAIQGTTSLLNSVHKFGGQRVKRFVLLGSSGSVIDPSKDMAVAGPCYTEEDWNPVTAEIALAKNDVTLGYLAAKTIAEQSAWKFLEDNKTSFDMTVINPVIIIGPMLNNVPRPEKINESNKLAVYSYIDGAKKRIVAWEFPCYDFVDVRDVSHAHIRAMNCPATSNQRIILSNGLITPQMVANIIRKNFPQLKDMVHEGNPSQIMPDNIDPTNYSSEKSRRLFGEDWTYTDVETSVVDTVKDILRIADGWQK